MLQPIGDDDDTFYRIAWVLKLLPALRLNQLIVLGSSDGLVAYDSLEGLIKYGTGWKELHFITRSSEMLGFAKFDILRGPTYWRRPQPSIWHEMLLQRDGTESGASVSIYRATQPDATGAVLNPLTRQVFEQTVSSLEDLKNFGMEEDKVLLGENEIGKELLTIIKRGHNVDIEEQDGPPYLAMDIRQWAHDLTWAEIRRCRIGFLDEDEDDDEDFFGKDDVVLEVDTYNEIDEYVWLIAT